MIGGNKSIGVPSKKRIGKGTDGSIGTPVVKPNPRVGTQPVAKPQSTQKAQFSKSAQRTGSIVASAKPSRSMMQKKIKKFGGMLGL